MTATCEYTYMVETHCHTSETSRCGMLSGAEMAEFYHGIGYSAIVITDHFFNGNTTVPHDKEWAERVALFCRGYENAAAAGVKLGIDVFFAWEYTYRGSDFLTYGLDAGWLYAHPEVMNWSLNEYLDAVRAEGAAVVHAHPFREAAYIPMIHLNPSRVDAVETCNVSVSDEVNARAEWYAESYGLKKFHGSDNHHGAKPTLAGILTSEKIQNEKHLAALLKNGSYTNFKR